LTAVAPAITAATVTVTAPAVPSTAAFLCGCRRQRGHRHLLAPRRGCILCPNKAGAPLPPAPV